MPGGVEFEAGGKRRVLRYSMNALVRLEEATGRSVTELGELLGEGARMTDVRLMFWAALDGAPTLDEAGDVMDEIGLDRAGRLISEAFQAAFPAADGEQGNGAATGVG